MPTAVELGNEMLQALAEFFNLLRTFFIHLMITGNNETTVNASRGPYQSFWEIWYSVGAMIHWFTNMMVGSWGFVDLINRNSTLENEFADVVAIAAKNATWMIGDIQGTNSTTFLIKVMVNGLSNQSNQIFVVNLWSMITEMIRLVSDALGYFPTYFP